MERISRGDIKTLVDRPAGVRVSLFMPTNRCGVDGFQIQCDCII